ncbi:MAG: OmpH family outer membrane protein [Halofilum sp. (in: g-proteobacteria)]
MRKILTTFLLLVAVLPALAFAQTQTQIAFVDVGYLVDSSPQAQAASEQLQEKFGPAQEQLQQKQQEFQGLREQLEKDSLVMSEEEREEDQQRLQQLGREIQSGEKSFRDALNNERNQALQGVREDVLSAVERVAEEAGYDLVVGQGTVYASDAVDITSQVLERMEANFESGSQ